MERETALMTVFFMAWLLCGCSVESFFDGGWPVAVLAALVAVAVAMIMASKEDDE